MSCRPELTALYLDAASLSSAQADVIMASVQHDSALATLSLSSNAVGDRGADSVASALTRSTTITHLALQSNGITVLGAKSICSALRMSACALVFLDMSGNPLGDAGAIALGHCLDVNTFLKQLYLVDCDIGNDGAASLVDSLVFNQVLQLLDLSGNRGVTEVQRNRLSNAILIKWDGD